ncbi:hypothetical protein [Aliiruegeria lutimaris]|uniref:hypothetical protein n=1 Tax=Aliiruegeria lutimaris TaxID=571298 RepID=UPI00147FA767|nr:hypothetical protein [Aliiruegeria lutimaris]
MKSLLYRWLEQFHVTPRTDLGAAIRDLAEGQAVEVQHREIFRGYAQIARIRRLPNAG